MDSVALAHQLKEVSLFRAWPPKKIDEFLARQYHGVVSAVEGELLVQRGDRYEDFWILVQGALRAEIPDHAGKSLIVETLRAPQTVASAVYFSRRPNFPVNLVATRNCRILSLGRNRLLDLAAENRDLLEALLGDMGDRLQFLAEKLRVSRFHSLREKIASYLMQEARKQGGPKVEIAYHQGELADIFGVARPSLNRTLKELEAEGFLSVAPGVPTRIEIVKPEELRRVISEG